MAIYSVTDSALRGIQHGFQGVRHNAAEIASARHMGNTAPTKDLARSLVELHQNELYTSASVKTLRTAHEMIGTLLDIKA